MLDIGWSEMAVIALVALVIIGPKDLPRVMRTMGQWAKKARALTREFQSSVDEMIREADLEDARKAVESTRNMNLDTALDQTIDPTGSVKDEMRDVEATARSEDPSDGTAGTPARTSTSSPVRSKDSGAADSGDGEAEGDEQRATVISHPTQVAPPHSVVPPPDPYASGAGADEKPDVTADDSPAPGESAGSQKSA